MRYELKTLERERETKIITSSLSTTPTSLTVEALYKMAGKESDKEDTRRKIEEIWLTMDTDSDGEITKEEFIENALKSELISVMFSNI